MAFTLTQKIYARAAGSAPAAPGAALAVRPDRAFAYDFPGISDRLIDQLGSILTGSGGEGQVTRSDGERVMFIDHLTTRRSPRIDAVHDQTRQAAHRHGFVLHEGVGIGHQALMELGYATPGALLVHFDPHIAAAGASGALALGIGNSYQTVWTTGLWHTVMPPAVRLRLGGRLAPGVDGRDLAHHLIRVLPPGAVAGAVLELEGPGLQGLSPAQRQTLCAVSVFTGALTAVCLGGLDGDPAALADVGAVYASSVEVDLGDVEPLLVLPGSTRPEHVVPVCAHLGERINRAYVGSCTSGRLDDLRAIVQTMQGRRVAEGVQFVVVPASQAIQRQAHEEGLLAAMDGAGVTLGDPSCDACYGFAYPLDDGDTCLSSGTLNTTGRMGSASARIMLASPASVAAAAVEGRISDPRRAAALPGPMGPLASGRV